MQFKRDSIKHQPIFYRIFIIVALVAITILLIFIATSVSKPWIVKPNAWRTLNLDDVFPPVRHVSYPSSLGKPKYWVSNENALVLDFASNSNYRPFRLIFTVQTTDCCASMSEFVAKQVISISDQEGIRYEIEVDGRTTLVTSHSPNIGLTFYHVSLSEDRVLEILAVNPTIRYSEEKKVIEFRYLLDSIAQKIIIDRQ